MKYQLEIQLPITSSNDFDTLIKLENALIDRLADQHEVDGNDFGSGTMTVFILTDDPDQAFEASKSLLTPMGLLAIAQIMYRAYPEGQSIPLWPMPDNVARIMTYLQQIQEEGGSNNFVVFVANPEANYYIQFAGEVGQSKLYAEAVSNNFLEPKFKLNDAQISHLETLGWKAPPPDGMNFFREWQADTEVDRQQIAQEVMRTLTEVYGVAPHQVLGVNLVLE